MARWRVLAATSERESSNVQCTQSHLCSSEHPHIIQDDRTSIFTGLNPLNQLLAENLKYVFVRSVCSSTRSYVLFFSFFYLRKLLLLPFISNIAINFIGFSFAQRIQSTTLNLHKFSIERRFAEIQNTPHIAASFVDAIETRNSPQLDRVSLKVFYFWMASILKSTLPYGLRIDSNPVQWTQEAYNNLSSNAIGENNSVFVGWRWQTHRIRHPNNTANTSNIECIW